MKKRIVCGLVCVLLLLALVGCGGSNPNPINKGETYLDGSWYNEDLNIGYNFFPNGTGFQFIGSTVNPIRYGFFGDALYVSVFDEEAQPLPYSEEGDNLKIFGFMFYPVEDDPAVAASVEALLAEQSLTEEQKQTGESKKSPFMTVFLILSLAVVVFVLFLFVWVRKKKLQSK